VSTVDATAILQIKVWLTGISPMVWRRVLVSTAFTLRELHGVIQVAMGWESIRIRGIFMKRLPERQSCRSRGQGTTSRIVAGACHRVCAFGSVAAGGRRALSTASAAAWQIFC
jgi:hypothetical protein